MAKLLATLLWWSVFVVTAPVIFLGGVVLFIVTAPFDPQRAWMHRYVSFAGFQFVRISPLWRAEVIGREKLPKGPAVIVANHQSMADVGAACGLKHPFKFVSKASLFALPFVGWLMGMARYVAVHRGRPRSMNKMMEDCRGWLRQGVSVLLFPEGTYSPDGKLLPFKRGAFQLAISEKVPVVPVHIHGTRSLIIEDGPWMNLRGHVRVEVMDPIPVDQLGDDDAALAERVRALYLART